MKKQLLETYETSKHFSILMKIEEYITSNKDINGKLKNRNFDFDVKYNSESKKYILDVYMIF